jgi:hypothetical protein
MGAPALGVANAEQQFGNLLMDHLRQPGTSIGQAVQAAKADLARTAPYWTDIFQQWTILGDPTLIVTP